MIKPKRVGDISMGIYYAAPSVWQISARGVINIIHLTFNNSMIRMCLYDTFYEVGWIGEGNG